MEVLKTKRVIFEPNYKREEIPGFLRAIKKEVKSFNSTLEKLEIEATVEKVNLKFSFKTKITYTLIINDKNKLDLDVKGITSLTMISLIQVLIE